MKNFRTGQSRAARFTRAAICIFSGVALGAILWTATAPMANAREMNAAEMLQAKMPAHKMVATGTKPEVLDAVCAAVRQWRKAAPQIVRAAVLARHEFAGDIVNTAITCLRRDQVDCALFHDLLRAAIEVDPDEAARFTDEFTRLAPDCGGAEGADFSGNGADNVNPPPGSVGGGGGASRSLCQVCHNGHEIRIPCDQVPKYLRHHPGDNAGACTVTPTQNQ